jgi:hypothetical protein
MDVLIRSCNTSNCSSMEDTVRLSPIKQTKKPINPNKLFKPAGIFENPLAIVIRAVN